MDASMDNSQKPICDDLKYGQFSMIVALESESRVIHCLVFTGGWSGILVRMTALD